MTFLHKFIKGCRVDFSSLLAGELIFAVIDGRLPVWGFLLIPLLLYRGWPIYDVSYLPGHGLIFRKRDK